MIFSNIWRKLLRIRFINLLFSIFVCFPASSDFLEVSFVGSTSSTHTGIASLRHIVSGSSSLLFVELVPGTQHLVVNCLVLVNDCLSVDLGDPGLWSKLEDCTNQQVGRANGNAGSPLTLGHLLCASDRWEPFAHENLCGKSADHHHEEVAVVQELLEHVEVSSSNLTAVDLVEELQENEGVENVGEVLSLCLSLWVQWVGFVAQFRWNAE